VAALGSADGGYFPHTWGWATLALLWVALAALLLRPRIELSRSELAFGALLAALVAWTALSALWSWSLPLSLLEVERELVYLAGVAALLLAGARGSAPWLAAGVLAAAVALCGANLLLRLRGVEGVAGGEAAPIGYANGLGLVGALGVILALGLSRGTPRRGARTALLALAVVPAAALLLSESRGAALALAVGLVALAALARGPAAAYPAAVAAGLAIALAAAFAFGSERERYWRVTLAQAESAPLHGTGAGTFERAWLRDRPAPLLARDAHGLYVETLGELGIVGLALLLGLLAVPVAAATAGRADPAVAAAGAAYAAFLVHAGVDWQWELPAVTLAGLACGVVPLLAARRGGSVVAGRARASGLAAAAVLGALSFAALVGRSALAEGGEALREGRAEAAERLAGRAGALLRWSGEPWRLEGEARIFLGRQDEARASFRRALERDDSDPELWRALARVAEGEERRRALEHAALLDPLGASG
jgi:O-antigen ligase